jgi:hypothetical protein
MKKNISKYKKLILENSFDGSPSGYAGSVNSQPEYGTFGSPDASQNPGSFDNSHLNKPFDQNVTGQPDTQITDKSGSFDPDIERLFKGKEKPTIDAIMTGIQYELANMIKKDKHLAKERVINNMKKHGPKYYTKLGMLGMPGVGDNLDENMINENNNDNAMKFRVDMLNDMVKAKQAKRIEMNPEILNILKDKREQKTLKMEDLIKKSVI